MTQYQIVNSLTQPTLYASVGLQLRDPLTIYLKPYTNQPSASDLFTIRPNTQSIQNDLNLSMAAFRDTQSVVMTNPDESNAFVSYRASDRSLVTSAGDFTNNNGILSVNSGTPLRLYALEYSPESTKCQPDCLRWLLLVFILAVGWLLLSRC